MFHNDVGVRRLQSSYVTAQFEFSSESCYVTSAPLIEQLQITLSYRSHYYSEVSDEIILTYSEEKITQFLFFSQLRLKARSHSGRQHIHRVLRSRASSFVNAELCCKINADLWPPRNAHFWFTLTDVDVRCVTAPLNRKGEVLTQLCITRNDVIEITNPRRSFVGVRGQCFAVKRSSVFKNGH